MMTGVPATTTCGSISTGDSDENATADHARAWSLACTPTTTLGRGVHAAARHKWYAPDNTADMAFWQPNRHRGGLAVHAASVLSPRPPTLPVVGIIPSHHRVWDSALHTWVPGPPIDPPPLNGDTTAVHAEVVVYDDPYPYPYPRWISTYRGLCDWTPIKDLMKTFPGGVAGSDKCPPGLRLFKTLEATLMRAANHKNAKGHTAAERARMVVELPSQMRPPSGNVSMALLPDADHYARDWRWLNRGGMVMMRTRIIEANDKTKQAAAAAAAGAGKRAQKSPVRPQAPPPGHPRRGIRR